MDEGWLGDTRGTIKSSVLKGLMLVVGWERKTSKQTFTRPSSQGALMRGARGVGGGGQGRTGEAREGFSEEGGF